MIRSLSEITGLFSGSDDTRIRSLPCKRGELVLFYVEEVCNLDYISHFIVEPVVRAREPVRDAGELKGLLTVGYYDDAVDAMQAVIEVFKGSALLYFSYTNEAILCDARKTKGRAIEKSETEVTMLGPRESFNEHLLDNIALIRKRLATPSLKVERLTLGKESKTSAALLHVQGRVPPKLLDAVHQKIQGFQGDFILNVNYIAEELSGQKTLLDLTGATEMPDIVVSRLMEGRVVLLVQGTQRALITPGFFIESLQAADDYYSNRYQANILRVLRLCALAVTVCLPGIYIALSTHHFSLIPTTFIFKMAVSRSGVPFPTIVEMLLMQFFFELAREAGRRLPQQVGQSLSVVAALILGEAAVGAGLTSEITVIIVGVYAIASFINPKLTYSATIWSLVVTAGAFFFGLHGFYISLVIILAHLAGLKSFGYPFLFPLGTATDFHYKPSDVLWRGRLRDISKRLFGGGGQD